MKEVLVRARRQNLRAIARHVIWLARLVIALVVSAVVFNLTTSLGLVMWFAWGSTIGLILSKWRALWFAALVSLGTLWMDHFSGDRGELDAIRWYVTAFWSLIPTTLALTGIALGVAVTVVSRHLVRRLFKGWPGSSNLEMSVSKSTGDSADR